MGHLDIETLSAYIDHELPPAQAAQVERHLASCDACRREYDDLLAVARLVRGLPIYQPRRRIEIEADERDRDSGPLPMILDFARPVALAAVIILIALAGLRLATDPDDPAEEGQIAFTETQGPTDGTDQDAETSESVPGPEGAAPEMAQAPQDSAEDVTEAILQQAEEAGESANQVASEEAPADSGVEESGLGIEEALIAGTVILVIAAAAWRVRKRDPVRTTRA